VRRPGNGLEITHPGSGCGRRRLDSHRVRGGPCRVGPEIWFNIVPMATSGAVCGLSIVWSYKKAVERHSPRRWFAYNAGSAAQWSGKSVRTQYPTGHVAVALTRFLLSVRVFMRLRSGWRVARCRAGSQAVPEQRDAGGVSTFRVFVAGGSCLRREPAPSRKDSRHARQWGSRSPGVIAGQLWWGGWDSNPRPRDYESSRQRQPWPLPGTMPSTGPAMTRQLATLHSVSHHERHHADRAPIVPRLQNEQSITRMQWQLTRRSQGRTILRQSAQKDAASRRAMRQ
jgi:hypothetical protein